MGSTNSMDRRKALRHGAVSNRGERSADLLLGALRIRLRGLSAEDLDLLGRRWGGFLLASEADPDLSVTFVDAGAQGWLPGPKPGDIYRLEALEDDAGRWALSYNFALHRRPGGEWLAAVRSTDEEPWGRVLGNAVRYIVAHHVTERGGLALHAAAVLRQGKAYVLAGPSNCGKSTAVQLMADGISLGDDLTLILSDAEGWGVPATPFDNAERVDRMPPVGPHRLAGIWKLHQARSHRVERPPAILAIASLVSCASFSWAMPELAGQIAETAKSMQAAGFFAHLHFAKDPGFVACLP